MTTLVSLVFPFMSKGAYQKLAAQTEGPTVRQVLSTWQCLFKLSTLVPRVPEVYPPQNLNNL